MLFPKWTNKVPLALLASLVVLISFIVFAFAYWGSPKNYVVGYQPVQPIAFSHKLHAGEMGIDCRYCHTSVEKSSFAGIPPTKTCMNCHSTLWTNAPILEPVRASFRDDTNLTWIRVNDLPDFVYFNHQIHIHQGVGCATCHGQVDKMPLMMKQNTLHMEWCLSCHRHPEKFVGLREHVYDPLWKNTEDQKTLGARLVKEYKIKKMTDCSVCHR